MTVSVADDPGARPWRDASRSLSETPKSLDTIAFEVSGPRSSVHRAVKALTVAGIAEHVRTGGWRLADPDRPAEPPEPRKAKTKPPKPARKLAKVAELDVARAARHRAERERDERRARTAPGCVCSRPIVGADVDGEPSCLVCGRRAAA